MRRVAGWNFYYFFATVAARRSAHSVDNLVHASGAIGTVLGGMEMGLRTGLANSSYRLARSKRRAKGRRGSRRSSLEMAGKASVWSFVVWWSWGDLFRTALRFSVRPLPFFPSSLFGEGPCQPRHAPQKKMRGLLLAQVQQSEPLQEGWEKKRRDKITKYEDVAKRN